MITLLAKESQYRVHKIGKISIEFALKLIKSNFASEFNSGDGCIDINLNEEFCIHVEHNTYEAAIIRNEFFGDDK